MIRRPRARLTGTLVFMALGLGLALSLSIRKKSGGSVTPAPALSQSVLSQPIRPAPISIWHERVPSLAVAGARNANTLEAASSKRLQHASRVRAVSAAPNLVLEKGVAVTLPLFDGRVLEGTITLLRDQAGGRRLAGGTLTGGGHFALAHGPAGWSAMVYPAGDENAYRLTTADDGGGVLAAIPRGYVLCASLPTAPRTGAQPNSVRTAAAGSASQALPVVVPVLDSRPEAEPVLFLDFDGATVVDPAWDAQPIEAADSGLSAGQITRVWSRVAEDFRPFRINVTTDPARYAAARPMQRMRCIITTSSAWYGAVGGVAKIFSWREAGVETLADDIPCWAFSDNNTLPEEIALAVSHEAGHTLGLYHDGLEDANGEPVEEYYAGHGSGDASWGPIMGNPYGRKIIQWNAGDYRNGANLANNTEDDVSEIASVANHTGFATERRAATLAEAARLAVAADGVIVDHRGVITSGGAESWLLVAAGAGPVSLALAADDPGDPDTSNFDGSLTLATTSGEVLATADTSGTRFPQLSTSVAGGTYVLRVRSTGEGSPTSGGYSAYGSIGRFRVTGTVSAPAGIAPWVGGPARAEGRVGELFSYAIEAAGAGITYSAVDLPQGLALTADGRITGTPAEAGVFTTTVTATNESGSSSRAVVIAIAATSYAEVLDAPSLPFTSGGERPWRTVAAADAPGGGSAARSGEILDDYQTSWIQTTVTGPGRLKWQWKVSSELNYDFYHARLDGASMAKISGETAWAGRTLNLPAGAHTVRWSFEKDPYLAVGTDTAWLDAVQWARGFELWAEAAALSGQAAEPNADNDGDGLANLLEYGFDRNPALADGLGGVVVSSLSTTPGAEGALELVFDRPAGREDLLYTVEVSQDLITWAQGHAYGLGIVNGAGLPTLEVSRTPLEGGGERICVRDLGAEGATRRFLRVRLQRVN